MNLIFRVAEPAIVEIEMSRINDRKQFLEVFPLGERAFSLGFNLCSRTVNLEIRC